MNKLDDAIQAGVYQPMNEAWRTYMEGLSASMRNMEQAVSEAEEKPMACSDSWCANAREMLDDLNHQLFTIHEPKWTSKEDSDRIKDMKRDIHDIYARLSSVEKQVS